MNGDDMLKNVEVFVVGLVLFIGVILVFNARWIVKTSLRSSNENISVVIIKVIGYILTVVSLIFGYYII